MKTKSVFILFLLLHFGLSGLSQTDTIKLVKSEERIYQCITESAKSWYLREYDGVFYIVSLKIPKEEVSQWFNRFSDSQNIYRSTIYKENNLSFLTFSKPNDSFDRIYFKITEISKNQIILMTKGTEESYFFSLIEF